MSFQQSVLVSSMFHHRGGRSTTSGSSLTSNLFTFLHFVVSLSSRTSKKKKHFVSNSHRSKTHPIFTKPGEKFKLIRTNKERSCDKNLPQEGSQTLLKTDKVSRGRRSRWLIMRDVYFLFPTNRPKHSTSFNLKPP